ncbi:MAG: bifunctional oligoribonuclease/PAP phosphatase NrnA [Candidatus Desulforudis sp.]|nr:bifunctional oligoribonuclease/PAP phosphatase NrnA [Desulforudis sp.]
MINRSLPAIAAELRRVKNPLLVGHVMPDGDSVGSTLALGLLLEKLGIAATMLSQDPVPAAYRFLPGVDRIHIGVVPDMSFDCVVLLDCSVPERVGEAVQPLLSRPGVKVLNIDHHVSALPFADYNYIDPSAAAVGEIIFDLATLLGVDLTPDIAACLYTAIVTDTGSFRYENTSAGTHRRVARLIENGLEVGSINTQIYDEKPLAAVKLLHLVLETLTLSECGRIAWLKLTTAMEEQCGAGRVEAEDLINYARVIQGVEVGILFREMPEGQVKVGFRSKRMVDVSVLASKFGGGGHPRAAGCMFEGKLADAVILVIAAAEKSVREAFDGRGH